jgi:hypothetical protein
MSILKNITKDYIDKTISQIDQNSIPPKRFSDKYILISDGKRLPPKYVLSKANIFINGNELDSNLFNAVEAKDYLKKLGYMIETLNFSEIPRIFIAPRSGEQSTKNFEKTIKEGYKKMICLSFFQMKIDLT